MRPDIPSFQPLYLQIKALLEAGLAAGEWQPAEAIPSEQELAERFGVSQGTVRKAIDALAADNLLVRRQGKGTFVATHTEERASLSRFLRIRRDDGVDERPVGRVVDVRRAKATADIAGLLGIRPGDTVVVMRRLLDFGGVPTALDEMTLPATLFKGLTLARAEAFRGPMYSFYESQFGVRMVKAQEKLRAIPADAESARLLAVAAGTSLLAIDRLSFTFGDRPVEYRRRLCVTTCHHYFSELT